MRLILFLLGWGMAVATAIGAGEVRVVSQTVGTDELLLALAEPSQVAALSHIADQAEYSAVAAEAAAFERISAGDSEAILKFRPTLVLFADYSRAELVAQVRKLGVKVIVFDRYATLDDVYANLRRLARELGPAAEARAEALVASCRARMEKLETRLRGVKPVGVINASTYGLLSGAGSTFQDLCDHAGAENLATTWGGIKGMGPEPAEKMLAWPIDMVVLGGGSGARWDDAGARASSRPTEAAEVAEALAPLKDILPYRYIDAVQKGRAVVVPSALLASVTHHRIEAYEVLARGLHPEVFK